jgi:hypothetical protein
MGTRGSFLGVKRLGREADHSPPSSAEVKECIELYLYSPNTLSRRGALLKHRDNFTFCSFYLKEVTRINALGNQLHLDKLYIGWYCALLYAFCEDRDRERDVSSRFLGMMKPWYKQ